MRDLRETIKYMIRKECERNSLADLCEHWDVSIDDFYTFLNAADRAEAEVERLKMELNEQYVDENDTAWRRPSAEAYYLACKARRKAEAEVERLRSLVNLCDICINRSEIPVCMPDDIEFGCGLGNDNVVKCRSFREIEKDRGTAGS